MSAGTTGDLSTTTGSRRRKLLLWLILGAGLCVPAVLPFLGMKGLHLWSVFDPSFLASTDGQILWHIRAPRVLLGFGAGAALALAGMVFQAVFRNPLATPFTLGISSGAAFGTALAVKLGLAFAVWGVSGASLFSFLGALLTVGLIYLLTSVSRQFSTAVMLLAGVALSFFFSSAIIFIQYLSDFTQSFQLVRWLMGDLNTAGFDRPVQLAVLLAPCALIVFYYALDLDLLMTGDELALSRGVNVRRARVILFVVVSLLTGAVVSFCGPIGFVGMMVPHFIRLLIGARHRWLIPACVVGGGAFLVLADFVARTLVFPAEIPVGIVTALLGGPFFLWLLVRGKASRFFL